MCTTYHQLSQIDRGSQIDMRRRTRYLDSPAFLRVMRSLWIVMVASLSLLLTVGGVLFTIKAFDWMEQEDLRWLAATSAASLALMIGLSLAIRGTSLDRTSWAKQLRQARSWWWMLLLAVWVTAIAGCASRVFISH